MKSNLRRSRISGVRMILELFCIYYRHPCVATVADYVLLQFIIGTRVRSTKVADYVLLLFIYFFIFIIFFIHRSFSETTRPILTKFSGIVYSGVVWIIR